MVATAGVRSAASYITTLDGTSNELRLSGAFVTTVINYPSAGVRLAAGYVTLLAPTSNQLRTAGSYVTVVVRGHTENRKLRAWGFSLDGHDFYVLRLGETSSLVYDMTTGQWSRWASPGRTVLRTHLGLNWTGQAKTTLDQGYAWNVIGADDTTGDLWILDPNVNIDDNADGTQSSFSRQATGGVPARLREGIQCGAVYLTANLGSPLLTAPTVTLETSDDSGNNWINHGAVTVNTGDTTQELAWLGLGLMTAPGRLFRVTDSGAITRISSLDMRGLND
jgi:hypothetical protein